MPRNDSIDETIASIRARWELGELTQGEAEGLFFDVSVDHGFDATLGRLDEPWRGRLLARLREYAVAPLGTEWINLRPVEDPPDRAFQDKVLPAVRAWWAARAQHEP